MMAVSTRAYKGIKMTTPSTDKKSNGDKATEKKAKVDPNPEQTGKETQNLLLAVTGMSPAVVTETLYGIAKRIGDNESDDKEPAAHWPDHICIITTSLGKEKIQKGLIDDGWLQKVCSENGYKEQIPSYEICVIPDAEKKEVADALTEADHEALADFITQKVQAYASATSGEEKRAEWRIHASIAGGRKTMTFYLGYAMSLFGRHFDRMSHVLLETPEFEGVKGFYAPTSESYGVQNYSGDQLDAKNAKVVLTDIPFIRMRHSLPGVLRESFGEKSKDMDESKSPELAGSPDVLAEASKDKKFKYSELVGLINLGDQPEKIRLKIYEKGACVSVYSCDNPKQVSVVKNPSPVFISMYMLILDDTLRDAECRNLYTRPGKGKNDPVLFGLLVDKLANFMGCQDQVSGMKDIDALKYIYDESDDYSVEYPNLDRSLESLLDAGTITSTKFTNMLSELARPFRRVLPENLANYILPMPLFDKDGNSELGGRLAGGAYGINLNPDQIEIVE
jgi:CRISPR-associated protein (TIGR02584 family)